MPASIRLKQVNISEMFRPGGALAPAAAAKEVADFHRGQLAAAETTDEEALGHPVDHTDFVNGQISSDFESIRPGQSIVSTFDVGSEVVQAIDELLIMASPRLTGQFQKSISIYADGDLVRSVAETAGAAEIVFLSLVPYARKIERGKSSQAPDGVFQAVAAMVAARLGNQAKIVFTYREPMGGASGLETWARRHSAKATGRAGQRRQYAKDVRQPAIVVSFR